MAKRKQGGIERLASMPWPISFVLGIVAYAVIRYGAGWYLSTVHQPVSQTVGRQLSAGALAPFAWIALMLCWIGALVSLIGRRHRRQLLERQTGLESLRSISWRQFEMLVGEAFRRRGYAIQETGLGGADGGIDLILRRDGKTTLVQCKQWKTQRVDVTIVREMFGLLAHHGAAAVKIVAVGDFTADAHRFAQGKPIELIHGEALLAMVREAQTPPPAWAAGTTSEPGVRGAQGPTPSSTPACPKCGAGMVWRTNRKAKNHFWGCAKYPACSGTRAA